MKKNVFKLTVISMLCAFAFISYMVTPKIPLVPAAPFLRYDPKDAVIAIGGFLFGPLSAFIISAVVSSIELVTVSQTGYIGLAMNILSSCSFACTAAAVYRFKKGAVRLAVSLAAGVAAMAVIMLFWNYLITPLYMSVPRDVIASMLLSAFLPFNLIKGGINAVLTFVVFIPVKVYAERWLSL